MYKHASGAAKRKRKRDTEKEMKKQRTFLQSYMVQKQSADMSSSSELATSMPTDDAPEKDSVSESQLVGSGTHKGLSAICLEESTESCNMQQDPSLVSCAEVVESMRKHDKLSSLSSEPNSGILGMQSSLHTDVVNTQQTFSSEMSTVTMTLNKSVDDIIKKYSHDPAEWSDEISEDMREYFCSHQLKNITSDFSESRRTYSDGIRFLSPDLLWRKKRNGETVHRDWLIYSVSTGSVYCVPCKLYSNLHHSLNSKGFSDWKNAGARLKEHETSADHRMSVFKFSLRASLHCRVDQGLVHQVGNEQRYWREVLRRVVAVIKFLGERGLPFRGNDELFGSVQNGCFLGCLELLSQFDPFLEEHIKKFGAAGRGKTSYMSSTTVNVFIELMGDKVVATIVKQLNDAKYFSVIVDSTPDMSHTDQLAIVVRYVNQNGPVEQFLGFVPIHSHTGESLEKTVLSVLRNKKIDILNCRGQSYDNASNMSGRYNGLQARIRSINPLADYVPCAAHSLNLVGTCAAESCIEAVSFFQFLQSLYTFFSSSTHRWEILTKQLDKSSGTLTIKRLSTTRWAARADATRALRKGYQQVHEALEELMTPEEQPSVQHEAEILADKLYSFNTAVMLVVWGNILERLNATSKQLQKMTISLNEVVTLYNSLVSYILNMRDSFSAFENEAKEITIDHMYPREGKREKKIKKFFDEGPSEDTAFSARDKFIFETFYVIMDSLVVELKRRNHSYEILSQRFGFLQDASKIAPTELRTLANNLQKFYQDDLEDNFTEEFIQFTSLVPQTIEGNPIKMREYIVEHKLQDTFPNVETLLRIFLSMPVSNATGERSFSCLKRIKNERRMTMGQERLSALSVLAVETELVRQLDFDDLINTFAEKKSRKANLKQ